MQTLEKRLDKNVIHKIRNEVNNLLINSNYQKEIDWNVTN